ncbi:MAG: 6-phosphogluconolactonase [Acidimicrobiia bacterium]
MVAIDPLTEGQLRPPGPPRPVRHPDAAALRQAVCAAVHEALASSAGRFVALAVGATTLPVYAGLDPAHPGWAGRAITPVDELVPPPAEPGRRFAVRLAAALPPGLRPLLVPLDVSGAPEVRAAEFDARLRDEGLAVTVLGLGPDGHIGFNQPPTPADAPSRVVDLHPGNLGRLEGVEPARAALTMGIAPILAASAVVVVADGPGKRAALERLVRGPEDPNWPVTWLRRHPRLSIAEGPDLT